MPEKNTVAASMTTRRSLEHLPLLLLCGALFLTPLAHSGWLADPFGLPRSVVVSSTALILCLVALVGGIVRPARRRLRLASIGLAAGLLTVSAVASARSFNPPLALRGWIDLAGLVVVAWIAARFTRTPQDAAKLFTAALASGTLVAAGSLAQIFRPGFSLSWGGMSVLPPTPAGATFGDPGLAAQFLILVLPLSLGALALSRGVGRWLRAAGMGLIVAALLFAGRPEGWWAGLMVLGLMAGVALARRLRGTSQPVSASFMTEGAARVLMMIAAVVLLVAGLSRLPGLGPGGHAVEPLSHVGLLAPTTGDPAVDRSAAIGGTGALLALHPLGVGSSLWRHAFLEVAWTRVTESPFTLGHQAIHIGNGFLELAAEAGVLGGAIFLALFALLLWQATRVAFLDRGEWGVVATALLGTLLAAGVVALFGSPFQELAPALLFWVAAGVTQAALVAAELPPGASRPGVVVSERGSSGPLQKVALCALAGIWLATAAGALFWYLGRIEAAHLTLVGQSLGSGGNYRGAIQALEQESVTRSPEHLPAVLLGNAALRAGAPEKAVAAFGETLARSPFFLAARVGRAAAFESLGRYDRAAEDLNAALALAPGNADTIMARARLNARWGRLEASIEDYRTATRSSPSLADPWCGMGDQLTRLGRHDEAIEAYRTCATKNPRFPRLNVILGEAFEKKGLPEMSVRYYQRAASLDEKDVEPRLRLANALNALSRYCEAREALLAARDLEVDPARRGALQEAIDRLDPKCRLEIERRPKG